MKPKTKLKTKNTGGGGVMSKQSSIEDGSLHGAVACLYIGGV